MMPDFGFWRQHLPDTLPTFYLCSDAISDCNMSFFLFLPAPAPQAEDASASIDLMKRRKKKKRKKGGRPRGPTAPDTNTAAT